MIILQFFFEKYENSGIQLLLAPTVQRSIPVTVRDKGNSKNKTPS